ncbi:hypothetical protein J2Z69_002568 [Paenibacillus shirakamiensis]|uniref:SbsC C-terminal domain-containing protein n=1 Tax=Paenibacillus shirakamiensis TaxID=1265935 RepID=A0ABS4JIJ7_9BACL|nr:hypothetical protein [Paenibacillus shirakamiensis]MBP2001523.1 hypothetical protein [Paenibacillus shirakamiensis]
MKSRYQHKLLAAALLSTALLPNFPSVALGAASPITSATQALIQQTATTADPALKNRIVTSFETLTSLLAQEGILDNSIKEVHNANEQLKKTTLDALKWIDADRIKQLETKLKQTEEQYKPLFILYKTVSGTKNATAQLKLAVQLAHEDVRRKEQQLKNARIARDTTIKGYREAIANTEMYNTKIKSTKTSISLTTKRYAAEWSDFKPILKKKDTKQVADSLVTLGSLALKINEDKKIIQSLENQISLVIAKVKSQLAAPAK